MSNSAVGNTGWGIEIDVDVQMVASCPICTIYLVGGACNPIYLCKGRNGRVSGRFKCGADFVFSLLDKTSNKAHLRL
jgi:hypothetical protein